MSVRVCIPHDGHGTHTLLIALPLDDRLLDGADDERIVAEVARLTRQVLTERRERRVVGWLVGQTGYSLDELRAHDRTPEKVQARDEVAWGLRQAGWTLQRIGRLLARDHTSIMAGLARHQWRTGELGEVG